MVRVLLAPKPGHELREDIHIRLLVWLDGEGDMNATGPIGWSIAALPRPPSKAVTEGVHCAVSSWRRINDNAMPARVKATANYNNGRLATLQGRVDGYDNVIILTHQGRVSESPGSCFFMVRNGVPTTPGVNSDILESVTRATVMRIFSEYLWRETEERDIDRTELYAAEETFFCGSGYEIQPILSIDRQSVGTGSPGELTRALQQKYFALVRGETGRPLRTATAVNPGSRMDIEFADGRVRATAEARALTGPPTSARPARRKSRRSDPAQGSLF